MNILSYVAADPTVQVAFLIVVGALLAMLIMSRRFSRNEEYAMRVRQFDRQTEIEKRNFNEKKALVVVSKQDN